MTYKSFPILVFTAIATLLGCQGSGSSTAGSGEAFTTDSIVFEKDTTHAKVRILVDYPSSGPDSLQASVCNYISEMLGGEYEKDLNDGKKVVDYYGQSILEKLQESYDELDIDETLGFFYANIIRLAENTEKYVTYINYNESYEGGAHGMSYDSGVTFRKSDGMLMSQYLFNEKIKSEEFRQLLVAGLIRYFNDFEEEEIDNEEELSEYLLTDSKDLRLPEWPFPYFTPKGVVVCYSPYDIAPYAAGNPMITIPYDVVMPYLTEEAKALLEP